MSKYNRYAADLNAAFIAMRLEVRKAHDDIKEAEKNLERWRWAKNIDNQERKVRCDHARGMLELAKERYTVVRREAWVRFNDTRISLEREFMAERAADRQTDANALDSNMVTLLQMNAVPYTDLPSIVEKYANAGNYTMLHLIRAYASDHAAQIDIKDGDRADERKTYSGVAKNVEAIENNGVSEWATLVNAANTFACAPGRNKTTNPEFIEKLQAHWDDANVADAVANF